MIRIEIDNDADMTYIHVGNGAGDSTIDYGNVAIDLDSEGNVCGIEIFGSEVSVLELGKHDS